MPDQPSNPASNNDQSNSSQAPWDDSKNVYERVLLNNFTSVFEFLKAQRYKQKKIKRFEAQQKEANDRGTGSRQNQEV